jgi:hypothetical protein
VIGDVILASSANRRLSDLFDACVQVGGIWLWSRLWHLQMYDLVARRRGFRVTRAVRAGVLAKSRELAGAGFCSEEAVDGR